MSGCPVGLFRQKGRRGRGGDYESIDSSRCPAGDLSVGGYARLRYEGVAVARYGMIARPFRLVSDGAGEAVRCRRAVERWGLCCAAKNVRL
jgi:hypothetical protein